MSIVLGIQINEKQRAGIIECRSKLESLVNARWLEPEGLYVHLLDFGDVAESELARVSRAVDKAAAVTQSFSVGLGTLDIQSAPRLGHSVGMLVRGKVGMLQSMGFAAASWLPDGVDARFDEPWRARMSLGWLPKAPRDHERLHLEAALHDFTLELVVKELHLLRRGADGTLEQVHRGKLPAAA